MRRQNVWGGLQLVPGKPRQRGTLPLWKSLEMCGDTLGQLSGLWEEVKRQGLNCELRAGRILEHIIQVCAL